MAARFHIIKEFGFEAAHHFPHKPDGHENTRMHGHSFRVEVELAGEPDPASGCVVDFEDVAREIAKVRDQLDHHLLNSVPGLEKPTLEHLARWIAERLNASLPQLVGVTVRRPSCGESCRYTVAS